MYRFPSTDPNCRDIHTHTHIHSVPDMEDRIAKSQLLKNKANNPSNISSQQNTRRVSIIYTIKTRLKYIYIYSGVRLIAIALLARFV